MQIQGLSYFRQSLLALQKRQNEEAQAASQSAEQGAETSTRKADEAQSPQDLWRQLGKMGNVRSMTIEVMEEVSYQLYDGGQITLMEHSILSFNPGKSPQDFWNQGQENEDGENGEGGEDGGDKESRGLGMSMRDIARSAWLRTEADEEGRIDWIEEFQARLQEHQEAGEERAASLDQRILGILERLQAAARGGLNVTV